MSRKTRRRRPRRAGPAPVPAPSSTEVPDAARSRLRQRYRHMVGRSVVLGWESLGITITASSPEELNSKTDALLVERAKGRLS